MTTVLSNNVHNIAIQGTFDDCQALMKRAFNDLPFRDEVALSSVNSINWARVMAQVVYYMTTAVAAGAPENPISFSVPTGNFGCVFAGYVAAQMGLPIERLIVATNRNDILHRFFETGNYRSEDVIATQSPSMDIQVASNFERLLFDISGRDANVVLQQMGNFSKFGEFTASQTLINQARKLFCSHSVDEAETTATIAKAFNTFGIDIDPHTAVGLCAAQNLMPEGPVITLSTAHPAKFPDAVEKASGKRPLLPGRMADLYEREERYTILPNDLSTLQHHIRDLRRH